MNGIQIAHLLSMDNLTSKVFKGFALQDSEILPLSNQTPALYILNTDTESGKGEHWCAVLFYERSREFFDPFGMPPEVYGLDVILSKRNVSSTSFNNKCVQSLTSKTCGHHCLFYAFHRCRGLSLKDILSMHDERNLPMNDERVVNFVVQFGKDYYPMY